MEQQQTRTKMADSTPRRFKITTPINTVRPTTSTPRPPRLSTSAKSSRPSSRRSARSYCSTSGGSRNTSRGEKVTRSRRRTDHLVNDIRRQTEDFSTLSSPLSSSDGGPYDLGKDGVVILLPQWFVKKLFGRNTSLRLGIQDYKVSVEQLDGTSFFPETDRLSVKITGESANFQGALLYLYERLLGMAVKYKQVDCKANHLMMRIDEETALGMASQLGQYWDNYIRIERTNKMLLYRESVLTLRGGSERIQQSLGLALEVMKNRELNPDNVSMREIWTRYSSSDHVESGATSTRRKSVGNTKTMDKGVEGYAMLAPQAGPAPKPARHSMVKSVQKSLGKLLPNVLGRRSRQSKSNVPKKSHLDRVENFIMNRSNSLVITLGNQKSLVKTVGRMAVDRIQSRSEELPEFTRLEKDFRTYCDTIIDAFWGEGTTLFVRKEHPSEDNYKDMMEQLIVVDRIATSVGNRRIVFDALTSRKRNDMDRLITDQKYREVETLDAMQKMYVVVT